MNGQEMLVAEVEKLNEQARKILLDGSIPEEKRLGNFRKFTRKNRAAFMQLGMELDPIATQVAEIERRVNLEEAEEIAKFEGAVQESLDWLCFAKSRFDYCISATILAKHPRENQANFRSREFDCVMENSSQG